MKIIPEANRAQYFRCLRFYLDSHLNPLHPLGKLKTNHACRNCSLLSLRNNILDGTCL